MSQNPDTTENAAERANKRSEGKRKLEERLHRWYGGPLNYARIVARPKSCDKYYDLDETILAMGIFIDTVKEERLKNDPDFAFTKEFYRATMNDFNSLSDDNKAVYIAEAKKKNTVEDRAMGAKWVSEKKTMMDVLDNNNLEAKAVRLYYAAVDAERRKNGDAERRKNVKAERRKNSSKTGQPVGLKRDSYFVALKTAEDRRPYLAEATVRQLEEHAELVKEADAYL